MINVVNSLMKCEDIIMNIERISKSIVCSLLLIGFCFAEKSFLDEVERASKPVTIQVADGVIQEKSVDDVFCDNNTRLCKRYWLTINDRGHVVNKDTYDKAKVGNNVVLTVTKDSDEIYSDRPFMELFFGLPMMLINVGGAALLLAGTLGTILPFIWWSMFRANSIKFIPYLKKLWSSH